MSSPIILYTGPTPNGRKVSIALEEMQLAYEVRHVDILAGDQHKPEFLKLNPNNKFPVIIDPDGPDREEIILWESGAILWYLAEKTGNFLPKRGADRALVHQWLMFQMASVGPMFGQFAHFFYYAKEKHAYSIERYFNEVTRLLTVMEKHIDGKEWFAADAYTIADMAILPWVEGVVESEIGAGYSNLQRWCKALKSRPQVIKGLDVTREHVRPEVIEGGMKGFDDEHRSQLFGDAQHKRNIGNEG